MSATLRASWTGHDLPPLAFVCRRCVYNASMHPQMSMGEIGHGQAKCLDRHPGRGCCRLSSRPRSTTPLRRTSGRLRCLGRPGPAPGHLDPRCRGRGRGLRVRPRRTTRQGSADGEPSPKGARRCRPRRGDAAASGCGISWSPLALRPFASALRL